MTIQARTGRIGVELQSTVIIGLFEEDRLEEGTPPIIDAAVRRYLKNILLLGDFKGKKNQITIVYPQGSAPPARVLLVGLGPREAFTLDVARQASGVAVRSALGFGVTQVTSTVHGIELPDFSPEGCAQATTEGALLGAYRYDVYQTKPTPSPELDTFTLVCGQRARASAISAGMAIGRITAEAAIVARNLSNAPGNVLSPAELGTFAEKMAKKSQLKCKALTRSAIEKEGMGALLAVSQGSLAPPRFIIIEYGEAAETHDTLVFVGKGVTFDSGGISIKPAERMEEMKHDMSGAAAVIGAMQAIAELQLPIHVVGLIPATENLPSGSAMRPGDVIRALSGKTIEIVNTDAEGRLILADALGYACRYKPAAVIDLATLTGACVVALGSAASGMMGNNDALMAAVRTAGEASGERVWPLPLWEDYHDLIKSHIADVKNMGGRWGGALTAGAFLEKFVDYPWVHLDIAGTAWIDSETPYCPKGATGFGARLLVHLARNWGH